MTFPFQSHHPTPDQLDELLMGIATPEVTEHVDACAECQALQKSLLASFSTFEKASLAWSEARSNALNRDLTHHRVAFRISREAVWTCASLLLATLVGFNALHPEISTRETLPIDRAIPSAVVPADQDGEIARDNQMLSAIDTALGEPPPSPAQMYGSTAMSNARTLRQVLN